MPNSRKLNPRRPAPGRLALAGSLALLVLAGCDATEEPVVLSFTEEVRLTFASEDAMIGQTTALEADRRIDLASKMRDQGFGKAEVLAAYVESASLVVLAPFGVNVDFLDEAILQLEATEIGNVTVATQNDFPSTRDPVAFDVRAGEDVIGYVTASNFGIVLQIDPATLLPDEDYELGVEIRFRVEFEGI